MRDLRNDPVLAAAVNRYVRPNSRYRQLLHGNFLLRLTERERHEFVASLTGAARQATVPELTVLLSNIGKTAASAGSDAAVSGKLSSRQPVGAPSVAQPIHG